MRDQTERFVQSKHREKCLRVVPLSLSIDDRSNCVRKERDRWKKMIKIYIPFPLTDITSKYEKKTPSLGNAFDFRSVHYCSFFSSARKKKLSHSSR